MSRSLGSIDCTMILASKLRQPFHVPCLFVIRFPGCPRAALEQSRQCVGDDLAPEVRRVQSAVRPPAHVRLSGCNCNRRRRVRQLTSARADHEILAETLGQESGGWKDDLLQCKFGTRRLRFVSRDLAGAMSALLSIGRPQLLAPWLYCLSFVSVGLLP